MRFTYTNHMTYLSFNTAYKFLQFVFSHGSRINPGGSVIKNLSAVQETQIRPLGQEDPLVKEMATHSSILAWKILWIEEPWRAIVHGVAKIWT